MGFFSGLTNGFAIKAVQPAPAPAPAVTAQPAPAQVINQPPKAPVTQQTANTDLTLATSPGISAATYAPANIAPHTNANQTLAASTKNVATTQATDPNSLVSNNMNGLLSQANPYITSAVTRAKQFGNKRGLLNSSITAGAGEAAAISAALPIAQGDAAAQSRQSLNNQQYLNSASNQNASLGTSVAMNNASQANNMSQFNSRGVDAINQVNTGASNTAAHFNANQQNAVNQGNQNVQAKIDLANQNTVANQRLNATQSTNGLMSSYLSAYTQIQTNSTLNAANKTTALANLKTQMNKAQDAFAAVNTSLAGLPTIVWK